MTTGQKPKLNLVTIHGTFSGEANLHEGEHSAEEFYSSTSKFAQKLISDLSDTYNLNWLDFQWSGGNLESERTKASDDLGAFLTDKTDRKDPLLLLAHSHGGNVAFDWIAENVKIFPKARLITVGTPFVHLGQVQIKQIFSSTIIALVIGCICAGAFAIALMLLFTGFTGEEDPSNLVIVLLLFGMLAGFIIPIRQLVTKPFGTMRRRWKSRKNEALPDTLIYTICHKGDEAVSFLKSNTQLRIPMTFLARPLLYISFSVYWVVITTVMMLSEYEGEKIEGSEFFGVLIACSVFALLATWLSVVLPMKLVGKRIAGFFEGLTGRALSGLLWNMARGTDTVEPITMQIDPQLPVNKFAVLPADEDGLSKALSVADNVSLSYLSQNKFKTVQGLMETGGNFFEFLKTNPEIAKSLVHCNYFSPEMATYLGTLIPKIFTHESMQYESVEA